MPIVTLPLYPPPVTLPPPLTEAQRSLLSQEVYHLIRAQKLEVWCREADGEPVTPCWCPAGACLFGYQLEEAQGLREQRKGVRTSSR
jgi:hypothetical protein